MSVLRKILFTAKAHNIFMIFIGGFVASPFQSQSHDLGEPVSRKMDDGWKIWISSICPL